MSCYNLIRLFNRLKCLPVYAQRRFRYKRQWVIYCRNFVAQNMRRAARIRDLDLEFWMIIAKLLWILRNLRQWSVPVYRHDIADSWHLKVTGRFASSSVRPQDVSPPRRFASWTFRPLDVSPPGRFAPKTFRHLDVSPPRNGRFAP